MRFFFLILALWFAGAPVTSAQTRDKRVPLVVTAEKSLEWNRNKKVYIARGTAIAKQGTTELHGDTLTAFYSEGAKQAGTTITRIEAQGHVLVISDGTRATGDQGYYNVAQGYAALSGGDLSLQTATDTVTARDSLSYDSGARVMKASGQAKAVRGDDVITADTLTGRFYNDGATGATKMQSLAADSHVVITTPQDTLYGDHARYDARTNIATITGHVRIERGASVITGARGEVNLNTNISRIFGGAAETTGTDSGGDSAPPDGRVRGVFYPDE